MDEDGEKSAREKPSSEVDWLSILPDPLILEILLNLPTKDVVKSSVLSKRWRNLWKHVPGLDLEYRGILEDNAYVSFVDMFLGLNSESCIQSFKLRHYADGNERDIAQVTLWINKVIERKIQHLNVVSYTWGDNGLKIPPTVYKCEHLVSLKLRNVFLADIESVSLPYLKVIDMDVVKFANGLVFGKLISGCPVLESFKIIRNSWDNLDVLRVCSKSLLSFTYVAASHERLDETQHVLIDAPKLKYLKLSDLQTAVFVTNNPPSIVKVHMNNMFNFYFQNRADQTDVQKRQKIRNFFHGISGVQEMIIPSHTLLHAIYFYSLQDPLPQFRNLSYLHAQFSVFWWDVLPSFLESCPNLKSLVMGFKYFPKGPGISLVSIPQCLRSSLEFVKLERPIKGNAVEMTLVSYFLENATILKKLTLQLDARKRGESVILKELFAIPRLSSTCQIVLG